MNGDALVALALASDPTLQRFFLGRLASLVALHGAARPRERAALAVAAFSVFLDCLDLGLEDQARAILSGLHVEDAALVA